MGQWDEELKLDKEQIEGGFSITPNGRLYFSRPEEHRFDLSVIATGLSRAGRWSNLGKRFMSVAEHAMMVAEVASALAHDKQREGYDPNLAAFYGLHHDDHEAFPPGEIVRPFKPLMKEAVAVGEAIQEAIFNTFGWKKADEGYSKIVAQADSIVARIEALTLFPDQPDAHLIGLPNTSSADVEVRMKTDGGDFACNAAAWLGMHCGLSAVLGFDQ